MNRRLLSAGLFSAIASTALAAKPEEARPIEGLRIGPETTIVTGPLNDLGTPDYVAALDAKLAEGVSADENFWTAYCETLPRQTIGEGFYQKLILRPGFERACSIPCEPYHIRNEHLAKDNEDLTTSLTRAWTREELPRVAAWLDGNKATLARATEACARPKAYAPLITSHDNNTLVAVLLPHMQQARDTARALSARAFLALGEGRGDDAWKDIVTLHRLARHNQRAPFLIGNLVGVAIASIARIPTEACLVDPKASPEVLVKRWNELATILEVERSEPLWLRSERFMTLDVTLAIRSNRVNPKELLSPFTMLSDGSHADDGLPEIDFTKAREAFQSMMLKLGDVNDTLEFTNRYHDRVAAAFSLPEHRERQAAIEALDKEFQGPGAEGGVGSVAVAFFSGGPDAVEEVAQRSVVKLFGAAFAQCNKAQARTIARTRLLHAACAAELHYRKTGKDVADADELSQAIETWSTAADVNLPAMKDPYTNGPFHIAKEKDRLLLYVLGDNGKSEGGKTFGEGDGCDDVVVVLKR